MSDDFGARLFARVLEATHHNEPGVDGAWGMTHSLTARRRGVDVLESIGSRGGFSRRHFTPDRAGEVLAQLTAGMDGLARAEALLADQESRDLLLDVLAMRVLGEHHVRLPVTQESFRRQCAEIEANQREAEAVAHGADGSALDRFAIRTKDGTVKVIGRAFLVAEFFGEEQYALRRGPVEMRAEPGDVVIDAGGGWGETALYFADAVGPEGRVLSFEFVPGNLRLFEQNLDLNQRLRDRVEIVPHPSWDEAGQTLAFSSAGGQTSVAAPDDDAGEGAVTETIDNVCADRGVERVDFIKLDVEGAERATLRGAEETIRRDRPKLALSVYHGLEDFAAIPAWVDDLDLGYRLYLDHRWPGPAETILFAQPA